MPELPFSEGFPDIYRNVQLSYYYIFELKLKDGTTCDAYVRDLLDKQWINEKTKEMIPDENISGWRETYNCSEARQAMNWFFREPISIRAKNALADAFVRHIDREKCTDCQTHYGEHCYVERNDWELISELQEWASEHPSPDQPCVVMGLAYLTPAECVLSADRGRTPLLKILHAAGKAAHHDPLLFIRRMRKMNAQLAKRD